MKEPSPYQILKMEFKGIRDIICQYTQSPGIRHYVHRMDCALEKDNFTEIMYFIRLICEWYRENIGKILSNDFVNNKSEHIEAQKKLEVLFRQLQDFDWETVPTQNEENKEVKAINGKKVFIVHGHDSEAKITVARTLEHLGLEPQICHELPDKGKTIIEKLESIAPDVIYAIVLYTEDDIGRAKEKGESDNQSRARQNVVFEHGLFIGAIGRERVCALVKGKIEKPGDIDGVVYIDMDEAGAWKLQLCNNMKAVGIDVDMNKL